MHFVPSNTCFFMVSPTLIASQSKSKVKYLYLTLVNIYNSSSLNENENIKQIKIQGVLIKTNQKYLK